MRKAGPNEHGFVATAQYMLSQNIGTKAGAVGMQSFHSSCFVLANLIILKFFMTDTATS